MLGPIETYSTCDFPRGGVDPLSLSGSAHDTGANKSLNVCLSPYLHLL